MPRGKGEFMSSLNRVILIGRVATLPELRYTTTGKAVASFRMAVDRRGEAVARATRTLYRL